MISDNATYTSAYVAILPGYKKVQQYLGTLHIMVTIYIEIYFHKEMGGLQIATTYPDNNYISTKPERIDIKS